jgi:hypothetical protein
MRFPQRELAIHEHRYPAERIEREKCGIALFSLYQVDRHRLAIDPQLQQREFDLLRIGRRKVVQLHQLSSCVAPIGHHGAGRSRALL